MIESTLKIARCCGTLGDTGFLQFFRVVSRDDKANPEWCFLGYDKYSSERFTQHEYFWERYSSEKNIHVISSNKATSSIRNFSQCCKGRGLSHPCLKYRDLQGSRGFIMAYLALPWEIRTPLKRSWRRGQGKHTPKTQPLLLALLHLHTWDHQLDLSEVI